MKFEFIDLSKDAFRFLETRYGFVCAESSSWLIKYETSDVFVLVEFDGTRSYEICCSIGRMDNFKDSLQLPFDLGEVIRSLEVAPQDVHTVFQVTTNESLKKFLNILASQLEQYGDSLLIGNDNAFSTVSCLRDCECNEYAVTTSLKQMRSQLDIAWHEKNYAKVVQLLTPLKKHLTASECKKLKYAVKKIGVRH